MTDNGTALEGHGGDHAVAVARNHGVQTMWTLSGAHVFPLYDGAVKAEPPMRLVDVRHEPSAVFAAEATGKLTRTPGLAVLTAGPGVTNGVSPIAQAQFNGSPLVVIGGRAPTQRWGMGSLQELDQPPIMASITKSALTELEVTGVAGAVDRAFTAADDRPAYSHGLAERSCSSTTSMTSARSRGGSANRGSSSGPCARTPSAS